MFTYLNPEIRQRLIDSGKLFRIDVAGRRLDMSQPAPEGELAINVLGPIPLPLEVGANQLTAQWYATVRSSELAHVEGLARDLREHGGQQFFAMLASSMAVNSVLVIGDPFAADNPLVRVHSSCMTGDVFGSQRCECGPQFLGALERLHTAPEGGLLIYMSGHEGRGIGLWAKAATYLLQDTGENTYEANRSLGLPDDSRDFTDAAALLGYFIGHRPFRLLTNNPAKIQALHNHGLTEVTAERHIIGVNSWNQRYLLAKRDWGHRLNEADLKVD
ncbi:MAG: GTP cyclohydrolase II [Gammaproteobacteria bacterium]|nr:GTP cyclohydrolase II [Gammaproteobacteria bacterium]